MDIKIKKIRESSIIPKYASNGAAACDLHADIDKSIVLKSGERRLVSTGIAIEIPSKEIVALVYARSGLACKHGISLQNGVGVIDSDYRGEISVSLFNTSNKDFIIEPGMRIAQLCFSPVIIANLVETSKLSNTDRGISGFGSTGFNKGYD